ncbi:MAG TPA: homocysteine S-methyltransferase family protein [Clostridiales bacterium]|nr:homocysteine S-methyltransferase family protein [Clostridiales bacterium]
MSFLDDIRNKILIHDGSKGYMLQRMGLKGGECGENWNLTNKDAVREVYRAYLEAGADVLQTNTFPGNRIHLDRFGLGDKTYEINYWGARLAKEIAGDRAYVSASVGPTGSLMEPLGNLSFESACEVYREQVKALADGGADVINFETFTDLSELRAAYLAARDVTDLPVICSLAFETNGRTLMGTDPFIAVNVLKSMGADMVGANCSFGPEHMKGIIEGMYKAGGGYLSVKPNAGLPSVSGNAVKYHETPEHFADLSAEFVKFGARLIGGCCGTTPDFIKALKNKLSETQPVTVAGRTAICITSDVKYINVKDLDKANIYRIDAAKDQTLYEALKNNDFSWAEETALDLAAEGYDAILVNTDSAGGDAGLLANVIDRLQWYVKDPFIIETNNAAALERALRIYRGTAGVVINSSSDDELRNIAEKYGSVIISRDI